MALDHLVSMLFERGNAMQTFWGFYITVSLGLLAFFGSSQRPRYIAALVSFVFIAFSVVNSSGMLDIAKQREFLWWQLDAFAAIEQANRFDSTFAIGIKQISQPPKHENVQIFHIVSDIAVLVAIWFLTQLPRSK